MRIYLNIHKEQFPGIFNGFIKKSLMLISRNLMSEKTIWVEILPQKKGRSTQKSDLFPTLYIMKITKTKSDLFPTLYIMKIIKTKSDLFPTLLRNKCAANPLPF